MLIVSKYLTLDLNDLVLNAVDVHVAKRLNV